MTQSASRLIHADPGTIYRAFRGRDAMAHWLAPRGAKAVIDVFEPVPGGRLAMTLIFENAPGKSSEHTDEITGRFVDFAPDRRMVMTVEFKSTDPTFAGTMTMTWQLDARPDGTQVTVEATDVPAGIDPRDHEEGMRSTLANLAAYVE
ncbi:ATPase [Dyella terrae]|uniref:ATPase n=3 Tax=Rhodanobacteraceae TaxID=1775411 RepID=A0A4R0YJS6_9GAMM|nr:ATPase [Dyella terrae]TCI08732.1 ATPase [Dyella soli]